MSLILYDQSCLLNQQTFLDNQQLVRHSLCFHFFFYILLVLDSNDIHTVSSKEFEGFSHCELLTEDLSIFVICIPGEALFSIVLLIQAKYCFTKLFRQSLFNLTFSVFVTYRQICQSPHFIFLQYILQDLLELTPKKMSFSLQGTGMQKQEVKKHLE